MVNLKINKSMNNRFQSSKHMVEEYRIAKREYERMLKEAEDDIENGRVYTQEEVMREAIEILERKIPELSKEEQEEARKWIEELKNEVLQAQI